MGAFRERTGVLIVRAWVEPESMPALRARVIQSLDIVNRQSVENTWTTVDDVCASVRSWLEAFLAA